jgi:hypothetical protein
MGGNGGTTAPVLWVDTPGEREVVRRADTIKNALRRGLGLAALLDPRSTLRRAGCGRVQTAHALSERRHS